MDPRVGWALVVLVLVAGWQTYRWHGVALAATLIVFWLVLQFNRTLRVMKNAATSPVGYVESAPQLQAKLKPRMLLMKVVGMTRSLGQRSADSTESDEKFTWVDEQGRELTVSFHNGRCTRWYLHVPDEPVDVTDHLAGQPAE